MVWDIDSTPTAKWLAGQARPNQFRALRNRLLLSYLALAAAISGTFATVVYSVVSRDRNAQLNEHIEQVAVSAVGTLEIIQHEYVELLTEDEDRSQVPLDPDGLPQPITLSDLMGQYEADSILDVESDLLPPAHQGVQWYDPQGHLMVQEGMIFPDAPLPLDLPSQGLRVQYPNLRTFAIPVRQAHAQGNAPLLGYVRVTESTQLLESELRRLRWGLGLGGMVVAGLTTLSGLWLTRESLKPVVASYTQLRQFTSDASHELRNPLTAIRASVAVMQTHPERVHPADWEKLGAIASASEQMSHLVDDLLLLARMDRQTPQSATWRTLALDELLEDLVDLYGDRAQQAHLILQHGPWPSLQVKGDAAQLQRLFTNLLTNALQYTPAGGQVTLTLQRTAQQALVQVEDTGIGIAAEQIPHIFDRFWRADSARSWHQGGSGLGLAIAQTIAQHHHGSITVQSTPNLGSCFSIRLPLA